MFKRHSKYAFCKSKKEKRYKIKNRLDHKIKRQKRLWKAFILHEKMVLHLR